MTAHPVPRRGRSRRLLPVLLAAWAVGLGLVGVAAATPAAAHSQLVSSSPADGADLPTAPAAVTLTFNEDLLGGTATVIAADDTGSAIPLDPPRVTGPTVRVAWPDDAPPGSYTVSYRVVSADGHPITGRIGFRYAAPAGTAPPVSAAASTPPSSSPATTSPATTPPATTPAASPAAAQADQGASPLPWILAGVVVIGVAAAAGVAWALRRRAESER